ncbi:uncharacterized protein LOC122317241 isoform X2 [Carya illinoinensis]|uniref:uncharacterized protein LOC122317241 isoform X2 n=1 Tax=Carya illinoinensis TaxID=32201 RepID=UPI001C7237C8|nr:uncharacterized protein LOC122317241 isoform X2 [Carya illinoinensis]
MEQFGSLWLPRRISSTEVFLYNFEAPLFIGRFSLLRVLGHSNIITPIIPNGSLIKLRASIDWSRFQLVTNAARQISVPIC